MSDTQDGANSASSAAGGQQDQDRANAAQGQTDSAAVNPGSDAAQSPQDDTARESAQDGGANQDSGDGGDKPKKPKSDVQKSIDRYRRRAGEAERRADQLAEELARERTAKAPSETRPQGDAKPKLSDYPDYDAYQEALTGWTVKKSLKEDQDSRAAADRQRRQSDLENDRREHFVESSEAAREKYEDYDEVVFSGENVMPKWGGGLIADTENPGEVAYFLAKNPKESKRIFSLTPTKAAIELGKLEGKITAPPVKRPSNAPPPVSSPSGGGRAAPRSLAAMSPDEIYAKLKG